MAHLESEGLPRFRPVCVKIEHRKAKHTLDDVERVRFAEAILGFQDIVCETLCRPLRIFKILVSLMAVVHIGTVRRKQRYAQYAIPFGPSSKIRS